MVERNKILVDVDLLHELVDAQFALIENYKQHFKSHLDCGRWNDEINDLITTYNAVAQLIGRPLIEKIAKTCG